MRKTLMGGIVALALILAPATAANATTGYPTEIHGSLDSLVVAPGEVVTYTAPAGTYDANETVTTKINGIAASTIQLASAVSEKSFTSTANADGGIVVKFKAPETGSKSYTFNTYREATGKLWDKLAFEVVPAGAIDTGNGGGAGDNGSNGGGLASTGSDIAIYSISGIAVLLLIAGVVLLVVRRRRTSADSVA